MNYCDRFPTLTATRNITKKDFYTLLVFLNYKIKDYTFSFEKVCEGGIQVQSKDKNNKLKFTTVRLDFYNEKRWPWLEDNEMNSWENSEDVLLERGSSIAPIYKSEDCKLDISHKLLWVKCFIDVGFTITQSSAFESVRKLIPTREYIEFLLEFILTEDEHDNLEN